MYINYSSFKFFDQFRCQDVHVTGKNYKIGFLFFQSFQYGKIPFLLVRKFLFPSFILPISKAFSPAALIWFLTSSTAAGFTIIIMPMPILKAANISPVSILPAFLIYSNIGGASQLPSLISAPSPSGIILGIFSKNPPPVIWAMPFI